MLCVVPVPGTVPYGAVHTILEFIENNLLYSERTGTLVRYRTVICTYVLTWYRSNLSLAVKKFKKMNIVRTVPYAMVSSTYVSVYRTICTLMIIQLSYTIICLEYSTLPYIQPLWYFFLPYLLKLVIFLILKLRYST